MTAAEKQPSPFDQAVETYLALLDAGDAPDADEFCSRYPACADELRTFIDNLGFIDGHLAETDTASPPLLTPKPDDPPTDAAPSIADTTVPGAQDGQPSDLPAAKVRGYTLLSELGGGSQGVVYKAEEPRTKRIVALKAIREGAFATDLERIRFQNEVEVASNLTHPAIVRVYRSGEDQGRSFFTMEYVDGEPLDQYTTRRTLSIEDTLRLFLDICDGAAYAHRRGVIHRDLKPSNILIDAEGKPHILDFGLAKRLAGEDLPATRTVTRPGEFAGTWHYASPEQVRRDRSAIDVRTDVYALGVILYEMLTDSYPYPCDSDFRDDIARHVLETPATPPRAIRPELRGDLETIILRAIHKDIDRRYQSAAGLAEDIRRFLGGFPIEAKRDSFWYVARLAYRRHRLRVIAGALALAALVAFSVITWGLYRDAQAANATTLAKMDVVRASEEFTVGKLDELHWTANSLYRIRAAHPELPEVQRLAKALYEDTKSLFEPLVADMPEFILHSMIHEGCSERPSAIAWLDDHEADLEQVELMTREHRFHFRYTHHLVRNPETGYYEAPAWPEDHLAARKAGEAMLARALREYRSGSSDEALRSIQAVLSISLDLQDAPDFNQKGTGRLLRSWLYDALHVVLNAEAADGRSGEPFAAWVLTIPADGQDHHQFITRRLQFSRMIEAAARADGPNDQPYVDPDELERAKSGRLRGSRRFDPDKRDKVRSMTPRQALDRLDAYIADMERGGSWTWPELDRYLSDPTFNERVTHPIIAMPMDPWGPIRLNGRARTSHGAAILSVYLCRFHARRGTWPALLRDAVPEEHRELMMDPFIASPYVYKLLDDGPILYSLNADRTDNGGRAGDWCDPETDVVYFLPGRPWHPPSIYEPQFRAMAAKHLTPHAGETATPPADAAR